MYLCLLTGMNEKFLFIEDKRSTQATFAFGNVQITTKILPLVGKIEIRYSYKALVTIV